MREDDVPDRGTIGLGEEEFDQTKALMGGEEEDDGPDKGMMGPDEEDDGQMKGCAGPFDGTKRGGGWSRRKHVLGCLRGPEDEEETRGKTLVAINKRTHGLERQNPQHSQDNFWSRCWAQVQQQRCIDTDSSEHVWCQYLPVSTNTALLHFTCHIFSLTEDQLDLIVPKDMS